MDKYWLPGVEVAIASSLGVLLGKEFFRGLVGHHPTDRLFDFGS